MSIHVKHKDTPHNTSTTYAIKTNNKRNTLRGFCTLKGSVMYYGSISQKMMIRIHTLVHG